MTLLLEQLEKRELPAVFLVTTALDNGDNINPLAGSIRAAILNANANPNVGGPDQIQFSLSGTAPFTITPITPLPTISDPVVIDGTTQPNYAGSPLIALSGGGGVDIGLDITSGGSTVTALAIHSFAVAGIDLKGAKGGNTVTRNFIGTNVTGSAAESNGIGVLIEKSPNNTLGGTAAGSANVISGNTTGVEIKSGASGNMVLGNLIGTSKYATTSLGNTSYGVEINGATANTIGGMTTGAANIISGNRAYGVYISGSRTSGNLVLGNLIGTDKNGAAKLANGNGVFIGHGAKANTVGGTTTGAGNVISSNNRGVALDGIGTNGNVVQGNLIGTNKYGTAKLGDGEGVDITNGARANTVGGTTAGAANVISCSGRYGVYLAGSGTIGNIVLGNLIGTDKNGTASFGNNTGVVMENGATGNRVGGATTGAANVISGNGVGVVVEGRGTSRNAVLGNLIGTNKDGTASLGNGEGVEIGSGATANTVGGTTNGAANVISGNRSYGVDLFYSGTSGNVVLGNLIGTDKTGTSGLGNHIGVVIAGATANTVGGTATGAANVISGNRFAGVGLLDSGTNGNVVMGNLIGTDKNGTAKLANFFGVLMRGGATANTVGGTITGAANVISGNSLGVFLTDPGTSRNVLLGNKIGTDVSGVANIGNGDGVVLDAGPAGNIIGGTAPGSGNVIAFNETGVGGGVSSSDTATFHDSILGNSIFSNSSIGIDLGNDGLTPSPSKVS